MRYLALTAALLSPRPAPLLAFNEPEASLHPALLEPLAELLAEAARRTQVWVTTHSDMLASKLSELAGAPPLRLEIVDSATRIVGQRLVDLDDD